MKRRNIWVLCIIFLSGADPGRIVKNSLEEMNLKGRVKSVKQISYGVKEISGKLVRDSASIHSFSPVRIYNFNEKGNLIDKKERDDDGSSFQNIYKYDDKGNQIESILFAPDGSIRDKTFSTYDYNGKKIEEEYSGFANQKRTYLYDDNGYLVEENINDSKSGIWKTIYKNDDKGNRIEEIYYRPNGNISKKLAYKYDDKGNQIEIQQFRPGGQLNSRTTRKYDERNNIVEEIQYKPDDKEDIPVPVICEYKYDANNNWVLQITYTDKMAIIRTEREIEYYK